MKSIKRGRGPSMMSSVGAAAAAVFGIIWTIAAIRIGAPFFFPLFGIVFVLAGIVQAVYNYKNATGKNRYSEYDITENNEEPDPLESYIKGDEKAENEGSGSVCYCPYCGRRAEKDFEFCPGCGRRLPPEI